MCNFKVRILSYLRELTMAVLHFDMCALIVLIDLTTPQGPSLTLSHLSITFCYFGRIQKVISCKFSHQVHENRRVRTILI